MAQALKNLYDRELIERLCSSIGSRHPDFDSASFILSVFDEQWSTRELKARMRHITLQLRQFLPQNYLQALSIVTDSCQDFSGFQYMFFPEYVELFGQDYFDQSMQALAVMTPHASAEFAVRPFIKARPQQTMRVMRSWSQSTNEHLRRLASEGCRPRLPWAMALPEFKADPAPILPILKQLKHDESEYVRRSVANNLNDISKDNPDLVIDLARQWQGESRQCDWIIRHGCRSLLKQGHPEVLRLFGYKPPDYLELKQFSGANRVTMGSDLEFSFTLEAQQALGLCRLEYRLEMPRSGGRRGGKVFQISELNTSEYSKTVRARHRFRHITTRKYYPGRHAIEVLVNGVTLIRHEFMLEIEKS